MYHQRFTCELTRRTPWIILEPGRLFIMGRSIPEQPGNFYLPVQEWVSEYVKNFTGTTRIDLGFDYINTSSIKWIYLILKEISGMKEIVVKTRVTWYYEKGDDDMSDLGHILSSLVGCQFILSEVENMNGGKYEQILSETK